MVQFCRSKVVACVTGLMLLAGPALALNHGDLKGVKLVEENKIYTVTYGDSKTVDVKRTGLEVFLIEDSKTIPLGALGGGWIDSYDEYAEEVSGDVLVADLNFDGTPEILIKDTSNMWDALYLIAFSGGAPVVLDTLFAPTTEANVAPFTKAGQQVGFSFPVFNQKTKTFSGSYKNGPGRNYWEYTFIDGRYQLQREYEIIWGEELAVERSLTYTNGKVTARSITPLGCEGVAPDVTAKEDTELYQMPNTEGGTAGTLRKGSKVRIIEAISDVDGAMWVQVSGSAGEGIWLKDSTHTTMPKWCD